MSLDAAEMKKAPDQEASEKPPKKKLTLPKPVMLMGIAVAILAFQAFSSRAIVQKLFFAPPEEKKTARPEDAEMGETLILGDLVINPAGSGGRRHLLVSLGLEFHDPMLAAEITKRDPQIRDNLITLLTGQDATVLTDVRYRERIRQSLLKAINYHLKTGEVEKLYFVKYVFQ